MKFYILYFLIFSSFALGLSQPLFDAEEILNLSLSGDIKTLVQDREGTPKDFPFLLEYGDEKTSISVFIKTRGHFRRTQGSCTYPPLLIQFPKKEKLKNTLFTKQKNLKLVMPCKGDEYVINEYLVYKLYQKITPYSFKVRLVQITLIDTKSDKLRKPFYGILLEDEDEMADRNHMVIVNKKTQPNHIPFKHFHTMAIFEYMIGNTDWSVQYFQNIKLIAKDSSSPAFSVPYDFDHAGIVSAPYALPAPELQLSSTRDRRYRGYCQPVMSVFEDCLKIFTEHKSDFYNTYMQNSLLTPKSISSTIDFLDQFYTTIDNAKKREREFSYPCDPNGTGNVVIKGLKQ